MNINFDELMLTYDYDKILKNPFIIITGAARSGTSILGKIIGSLENVVYLFEPYIIRLFPIFLYLDNLKNVSIKKMFFSILFEDYFLQILHGRNINLNKTDTSYFGNYTDLKEIKIRWDKFQYRKDVIEEIINKKYIFVLKMPDLQFHLKYFFECFENLKVVHIIRNGNDVIGSSLKRNWYTNEHLTSQLLRLKFFDPNTKFNSPWYVEKKYRNNFSIWNPETRGAYIWYRLVNEGKAIKNNNFKNCLELKYEDLLISPEKNLKEIEKFIGSKSTEITKQNLKKIKEHKLTKHKNFLNNIEQPVLEKYKNLMKKLNYNISDFIK